jgi:hypothetical protein
LLHYDIEAWMRSALSMPLSQFAFSAPTMYRFCFSEAKMEEMAAQIQRYGTTPTGIGRIIVQMGRDRIWREPMALSPLATPEVRDLPLQEEDYGAQ